MSQMHMHSFTYQELVSGLSENVDLKPEIVSAAESIDHTDGMQVLVNQHGIHPNDVYKRYPDIEAILAPTVNTTKQFSTVARVATDYEYEVHSELRESVLV